MRAVHVREHPRGEKKPPFNVSVVFFPHSRTLRAERPRGGKDLTVLNKGDLHKPGSGSPAAVVNEKATASRQPH